MKLIHRFWFWYHTQIGLEFGDAVHHINRAEYHENKISEKK